MLKRRLGREWAVMALCAFDANAPENLDAAIQGFWDYLRDVEADQFNADTAGVYRKIEPKRVLTSDDADVLKRVSVLKAFAEERIRGVWAERDAIDGIVEKHLDNWKIYRLGTVERNVLRMGVWELEMTSSDTPAAVIINEAVDIAKYFSQTASGKFVNAVLDKISSAATA